MFIDVGMDGPNGYWEEGPLCKSCKRLIAPSDPVEDLTLGAFGDERFDGMDGLYHASCAMPFLSMLRALAALNRFSK